MGVLGGFFFKILFFGCQNRILQAPLDPKAIFFLKDKEEVWLCTQWLQTPTQHSQKEEDTTVDDI